MEYSLSNALFTYGLLGEDDILEIYSDIEVQKNSSLIVELGFQTLEIAEKFVDITSQLSVIYREDRTRYSMQFLADILKKMNDDKIIYKEDLYRLSEEEVIQMIEKSKYHEVFEKWKKARKVKISSDKPEGVYFVHHGAKIRYIIPLVRGERIIDLSKKAKDAIERNLSYDMSRYVYLDFDF